MNKAKKEIIAGAAVVASLGAAGTTVTAHADSVNKNMPAQTGQSAYQQKAKQNEQQLANLASANATKEQQAADSYAVANSADATKTDQQVATIKDQLAQQKQQAASQIAAASSAKVAQIDSQTAVINQEAETVTQSQQSANAVSEAQMQSANSTAIAQAQKQASDAAAHAAEAIKQANADYQTSVDNAKSTHDSSIKNANADYQHDLDNENKTYDVNKQQLQGNVTAAQKAVDEAQQAVKDHTTYKTVMVPGKVKDLMRITNGLEDQGNGRVYGYIGMGNPISLIDAAFPKKNWTNPLYRNANFGLYDNSAVTNKTNVPTSVEEMPTDFVPGLIAYNPKLDHSEIVSKDGLNEHQKNILASFMVSWANGFRSWIYNNQHGMWEDANKNRFMKNMPLQTLKYTTVMQQAGNEIAQKRTTDHLTNNMHTHDFTHLDSLQNVRDLYKSLSQNAFTDDDNYLTSYLNGSLENLDTLMPYLNDENTPAEVVGKFAGEGRPTMLGYLVAAYNEAQGMWYGEIYNDQPGHYNLGGHARSILSNDLNYATVALEKIPTAYAGDDKTPINNSEDHAQYYALTIDGYGWNVTVTTYDSITAIDPSQASAKVANAAKQAQQQIDDALGQDANAPEFIRTETIQKPHPELRPVIPVEFTAALKNAQSNLKQVQTDSKNKLNQLTTVHQQNAQLLAARKDISIKNADQVLATKVKQAEDIRNDKVKVAKKAKVDAVNDATKIENDLNQKYQTLVKEDQVKLAQIETDWQNKIAKVKAAAQSAYETKLKSLGVDEEAAKAKINALLSAHQTFVKNNAEKLAALKAADTQAYNDLKAKLDQELAAMMPQDNDNHVINTGDHTVVLPEKKPAVNNGSVNKPVVTNKAVETNTTPAKVALKGSDNHATSGTLASRTSDKVVSNNKVQGITDIQNNNAVKKNVKQQHQLPQTGSNNAWVASAFGVLGLMFGLGLARKKRY